MSDKLEKRVIELIRSELKEPSESIVSQKHWKLFNKKAAELFDRGVFDKEIERVVLREIKYQIIDGDVINDYMPWKKIGENIVKIFEERFK